MGCSKTAIILRLMVMVLLALPSCARAGEVGLIVNGWSVHLGELPGENLNEDNWGAGFQYEFAHTAAGWRPLLQISGFIDSNYHNSYYGGGGFLYPVDTLSTRNRMLTAAFGAIGFLMFRKADDDEDGHDQVIPGILPVLSLGTRYLDVNVTYVPKYTQDTVPVFFFQVVVPLGSM